MNYKRVDDNGFSLVELVIVIAIMAILVALLAPQYIKYVEKSKLAADEELLQNIHDVIAVAITDENIKDKPLDGMSIAPIQNMDSARYPDFVAHIMNDLSETDLTSLSSRLQSRHYRGQTISLEISSLQKVTIVVVSNDGNMSLKF